MMVIYDPLIQNMLQKSGTDTILSVMIQSNEKFRNTNYAI